MAAYKLGGGGIELPPLLTKEFEPVAIFQRRAAAATLADRAAAMNALSRVLDRFLSNSDADAVRAAVLLARADLLRKAQLSPDEVTGVLDDYQQAAELFETRGFPLWHARVLNKLGNHCQTTNTNGDIVSSLKSAIEYHKQALTLLSDPEVMSERGEVLHNLGNDYTKLHEEVGNGQEEAIKYYREALTIRTRDRDPRGFAESSHGLGRALARPATETFRGTNAPSIEALDEAIIIYQAGIAALEPSEASALYSASQHDLGVAYSERSRAQGDEGIETLTKAIHAFKSALRFRSSSINAEEYATTQNALGVAYLLLPLGSQNALREAERCFREALRFRSIDLQPDYFSDTVDNLGIALLREASDEPGVQAALKCFANALRARPREKRPHGHAQTLTHFGHAYEKLAKFGVLSAKDAADRYFK
jgi:tetratricopeptide (TPR) repeat protein